MSDQAPIHVRLIGFQGSTLTMLKSTLNLFGRKGRSFEVDVHTSKPDLYIIDGDATEACVAWRASVGDSIKAPILAVGQAPFGLNVTVLAKPIRWASLYETLLSTLTMRPPTWSSEAAVENANRVIEAPMPLSLADGHGTLLVVDDSMTVRRYMGLKLSMFGMQVDFAESGEEAVEKSKSSTYAAIFLDVLMSGMDGYEACKLIRANLGKEIPIIMVTSKDSPFDKMRGMQAGCSAYLVKPLDDANIAEVMARLLKVKRV
jgi:two-component system cell cycle response regulator